MSKVRRGFVLVLLMLTFAFFVPEQANAQAGGTISMYCQLGDDALVRVRVYGAGVVYMDFYYSQGGYNKVRRGTWTPSGATYVSGWFINPGDARLNRVTWGSTSGGHQDFASCL